MYNYDIGYGTCEESQHWQYTHENIFTEKELQKIVKDCLFEVIDYLSKLKRRPTNRMNWVHFRENGPSFQDLMYTPVFHDALKKRGFKKLEVTTRCNVFGWASAVKPGNWKDYCDLVSVKIQRHLKNRMKKNGIYIKTKIKKRYIEVDGKTYEDKEYVLAKREKQYA